MSNRKYLGFNLLQAVAAMLLVQWIFHWETSGRMWATYFLVQLWNLSGYFEGHLRAERSYDE